MTDDQAYQNLEGLGAAPLWRFYGNLFPAQPRSRAVPFRWSWQDLRPHLLHFSKTLSLHEAERRVLMLVNPGLTDPPATVTTLYAGLQIILPGETAQAHRHTSNAFRFVLEGEGAYTTVNGEPVRMAPGDLLLTPGWHWHDHTHQGDAPMIWLDALDYPLVNALEAGFYEQYHQRLQPLTRTADLGSRQFLHGRLTPTWLTPDGTGNSPVTRYPWQETARALDAIADDATGSEVDGIALEYTDPFTGGPVMSTIGCRIHRLRPGFDGAGRRHTASTIVNVVRGEGATIVDGVRLEWSEHDTIAIPGWATYRHVNASASQDAVLFSYSDEPVMRALGLYRTEPGDPGA
ncbi:cupin domain-containing protein [Kitasatospora cineracea]|uniref:Gentisate 1,2-dioxygenase n=1 Tax=Kitasatospora cineracea TaxID=88074 RepID=A0A8G1UMD7_9ACTN|nr:cupin domain-containing protein [Kitasatospora cineracea]ROR46470.1 gentisate 1,2-dioxygenase [Kitasatospora cineracea]